MARCPQRRGAQSNRIGCIGLRPALNSSLQFLSFNTYFGFRSYAFQHGFSYIFLLNSVREDLEDEVNLLATVKHQNLIKILAFVMDIRDLCQVQEHALYGDLRTALKCISISCTLKTRIAYEVSTAKAFVYTFLAGVFFSFFLFFHVFLSATCSVNSKIKQFTEH